MGYLALFSNSHTKQYRVLFPSGSSFVSRSVQEQVVKIYNQIPELQYSTITCHGVNEELSNNSILNTLTRERAKNVQDIFLLFGMKRKHVKLSFGTVPVILVFKPKAVFKTSSLVTNELAKHKESHALMAEKKSYLVSNADYLYVFAAHSFETETGRVIKKGTIDIELTELCTNDQVVKCGVIGKQSEVPNEYGMYFNLVAHHQGQKLKLREGYVYKVLVNNEVVSHTMTAYKGNVIDEVMVWRKNKFAKVHQKYLSKEELREEDKSKTSKFSSVKQGYKTELVLNNLGWNTCMKTHDTDITEKMMVSLVFEKRHAIYLVSNDSKMVIPGLENLNFKDLYEFPNVPKNESFQIVALPIKHDGQHYVFQNEVKTNVKFLSPEISSCATSSAYNCVHIK